MEEWLSAAETEFNLDKYLKYKKSIQTSFQLILQLPECSFSGCFILHPAVINIFISAHHILVLLSKLLLPGLVLLLLVPHPLVVGALHPVPIDQAHPQAVISQMVGIQ